MDKQTTEHDLLTQAIAAAQTLGVEVEWVDQKPRTGTRRADAVIDLRVGNERKHYLVEVKKGLRPATLGVVLLQLEELKQWDNPVMLVTDHVTPQLAETLRKRDVTFLDTAGNAYINAPPVLIWVKGQRLPEKIPAKAAEGRALQGKGLRVVFALLCGPEWVDKPYREIANLAGVAHGTVGWVMTDLERMGFLIELQGRRRLRNRRRLLDMWVEAYARVLMPKLLLGRYRAPEREWWKEVTVEEYGLQLGAEPAAEKIDGYLRPGVATFYADEVPGKFIADYQLRTDPKGDVELRERFWNFDYDWPWPALVPPVLIFADLLALGDARCVEAARRIYEQHLAGLFEQG